MPPRMPSGLPGRTTSTLMLIGLVGLCLLTGAAAGAVTSGNLVSWFRTLARPPGAPPDWVFAPVWTALYVAMGGAAWLVWRHAAVRTAERGRAYDALMLWGWQLAVNALWPAVFFGLHAPGAGLLVISALLALIILTIHSFARIERAAAALLLPYLAWCGYATYLNAGFWWLNRG
jgi:benzodiazapine receptor